MPRYQLPLGLDHPGLVLHRYTEPRVRKDQQNQLSQYLQRVAQARASEAYKEAFKRWKETQTARSDRCVLLEATATAPLAIGLGYESVLEVSLALHHTYGMPIIPGTALKGLCRRGALLLKDEGHLAPQQFDWLFGTASGSGSARAGSVTFWDGWYDPSSVNGQPFMLDVVTVHHPQYYRTSGKVLPTDFDDPTPVPYLVVRPGARFLLSFDAPSQDWGQYTGELLRWCLAHLGVGGKTNAGYGFLTTESPNAEGGPATGAAGGQAPAKPASLKAFESVEVVWKGAKQELEVRLPGEPRGVLVTREKAQPLLAQAAAEAVAQLKRSGRLTAKRVEAERQGFVWVIHRIEF